MKKITAITTALVMTIGLAGCGDTAGEIEVKNSSSSLFVHEDMTFAMDYVTEQLGHWNEIPDEIEYLGDDTCANETIIEYINEHYKLEDTPYTECMGFSVDFHSSGNPAAVIRKILGGDWNIGRKVHDYQFWFARTEGGEWQNIYQNEMNFSVFMEDENSK